MPERGRQQTEMRQSQATLPSPWEGAASVERRALGHRGDPTGAPRPSARVGALSPPYPTLTGDVEDLAGGSARLPAQPHRGRREQKRQAEGHTWGSSGSAEEAG